MKFTQLIKEIIKNAGKVTIRGLLLEISINPGKINRKGIFYLYLLLNKYENLYCVTFKDMPYCLMPDAAEHILCLHQQKKGFFYDSVCKSCDFQNLCPGWKKFKIINHNLTRKVKQIPKETVIEITSKCNLNCIACTKDKTLTKDTPLSAVKKIINDSLNYKIKAVRFTGGEPLLHKNIKNILAEAKKKKFYVLLNTNATILNEDITGLLAKTVDNILISLQGHDKKTEQKYANYPLNWKTKISNILTLKSRIPTVRIGTVISRDLIKNTEKYISLIKKLGIINWELFRPVTLNKNNKDLQITKKDFLKIMNLLSLLKKKGMKVKIANPVPFCVDKNMDFSAGVLLGGIADEGYSRLVWDVRGYFKPSYFINEDLGKDIEKAWKSSFLQKIRAMDYLPSFCKNCKYIQQCRGGSRAIAKLRTGTYFSLDPLAKKAR